jgi:hypothetical protein
MNNEQLSINNYQLTIENRGMKFTDPATSINSDVSLKDE